MASELLTVLWLTGILLGVGFALLTVVGVVLLVRRNRRGASAGEPVRELQLEADGALLRLDDAVSASAAELDFATAQFGADRVAGFAAALEAARRDLGEAFTLKRRLEDATPDSDRQRREWNRRILALTEHSLQSLERHEREFSALRAAEVDAPARVRRVRAGLTELRDRAKKQSDTVQELTGRFDDSAVAPAAAAVRTAAEELDRAERSLATAETGMNGPVTAVSDVISAAERSAHAAGASLEEADAATSTLRHAVAELDRLLAATRGQLADARERHGAAPDADTADGITRAIAEVEAVLAAHAAPGSRRNPVAAIDELQIVLGRLDTALATARNQEQRLQSARDALDGALFSARSQIAAARSAVSERAAGAGARARLAEAERELELALHAADPVEALDAARRASSHARDADALARYGR